MSKLLGCIPILVAWALISSAPFLPAQVPPHHRVVAKLRTPAAGGSVTVEHTHMDQSASALSSYTFNSVALGSAETGRLTLVCVGLEDGDTSTVSVTGMTIDSNSMSQRLVKANGDASRGTIAYFYTYQLATVTSATVVVSFSTTVDHCGISVYKIMGAASDAPADTSWDINNLNESAFDLDQPADIDVAAGGVIIGYCPHQRVGAHTWTELAMDQDEDMGSGASHSSASKAYVSASTGTVITGTVTTGRDHVAIAGAWNP